MKNFDGVKPGVLVRHTTLDGPTYMVLANYGTRVTAVACADLTNPAEWDLVVPQSIDEQPVSPVETPRKWWER